MDQHEWVATVGREIDSTVVRWTWLWVGILAGEINREIVRSMWIRVGILERGW